MRTRFHSRIQFQTTCGYFTLNLDIFRDLLLRDNLFEIITSFRTFYIQVKTRLSLRSVFTVSWPVCSQGYSPLVVVSQRSAAEVLQRSAIQSHAKFVFVIHTQPSVAGATASRW